MGGGKKLSSFNLSSLSRGRLDYYPFSLENIQSPIKPLSNLKNANLKSLNSYFSDPCEAVTINFTVAILSFAATLFLSHRCFKDMLLVRNLHIP